ncbi:MAG: arginase family protein [Candidatus Odinarchaeota archaeon]
MKICLIQVPYHLGKKAVGMGLGPVRFLQSNLVQNLLDRGYELKIVSVQLDKPIDDELEGIIAINNIQKIKVRSAIGDGYFPLILGGNCNSSFGTVAGLNSSQTGIIWLDAHGDFNTPDTSPSGFFDGMPFAVVTGQCHRELWSQIADIDPLQESHALHIGGRDLDQGEQELFESTEVETISTAEIKATGLRESLLPKLKALQRQVQHIYLHIDIDIVDPQEAPGVDYRAPHGFSLNEVEQIIQIISEHLPVQAAALTAYNPANDEDGKTLQAGIRLLNAIVGAVDKTPVL